MTAGFEQLAAPSTQYTYTEEIINGWTEKNLIFTNLENMKFLPSSVSLSGLQGVIVSTLDASFTTISKRVLALADLVPLNGASSISSGFARTVTESNLPTNLTLTVSPRYPEHAKRMKVILPTDENEFLSNTECYVNGDTQSCIIYERTEKLMIIGYVENQITLFTNVLNLYPSSNVIKLQILTELEELI
jgi:hypothetical protein